MRRDEALRRLAEHREELAAMGVGSLSLFGSVARDEAGPASDVDLLIELARPMGLFDLGRIQVHLEEIMGCKVDLVMPDALRPRLRTRVLAEAVRAT
jgi:predicted nucleotidyltransferase